jgi:hypothetical protein
MSYLLSLHVNLHTQASNLQQQAQTNTASQILIPIHLFISLSILAIGTVVAQAV